MDHGPLFIPAGEELLGEGGGIEVGVSPVAFWGAETVGGIDESGDIDGGGGGKGEGLGVGVDQVGGMTAESPEGGAEVAKGAFLATVEPEGASHVGT